MEKNPWTYYPSTECYSYLKLESLACKSMQHGYKLLSLNVNGECKCLDSYWIGIYCSINKEFVNSSKTPSFFFTLLWLIDFKCASLVCSLVFRMYLSSSLFKSATAGWNSDVWLLSRDLYNLSSDNRGGFRWKRGPDWDTYLLLACVQMYLHLEALFGNAWWDST